MKPFNPLTPVLVEKLKTIVGPDFIIFGDREKLEPFSHDEVAEKEYAHMPDCAVKPANTAEIAAIMKLANEARFPVTPRGGGSGLSGGAVPLHGGLVILFDRMNKVIEFDHQNMTITVEPGLITNEINTLARDAGLFYAGYPMSLESCFIGGNVAENAGGGKAVKYGVTSRYVIGLEVVTPTGEVVNLGGKLVKDVSGYNLIQLMIGSEGTLGIFTKITLKLMPLPKSSVDLLALFKSTEEAIAVVPKIMTQGGFIPTSIEYMDKTSFKAASEFVKEKLPDQKAEAMLLITVDGSDPKQVEREYEKVAEICDESGALNVYVGNNRATSEKFWKVRRNIAEAFRLISPHQTLEDIVVPIAEIPKMVKGLEEISRKWDLPIPCYGHAGDGNLHATPVMNPNWSMDEWKERLPRILEDIYVLTKSLGGALSGEHGIGHKRKKYMPLMCAPEHLGLMKTIKQALDPNGVLNPGKIFDL